MFEGCEKFLDQIQINGDKLHKRMMYERKQQLREKYLKVSPRWILGTIKTELKLFEHDGTLDDLHDEHDKALAYWRQNCRQYPPERFETNIILICYVSFSSQGMSSEFSVRQGRSS
jgi:hypothetical protein